MKPGAQFDRREVDSIYVDPEERFVVSLIVGYHGMGYPAGERHSGSLRTPKQAAAAALALTRDDGSLGTVWKVYDRKTGTASPSRAMHEFQQGEFEKEEVR